MYRWLLVLTVVVTMTSAQAQLRQPADEPLLDWSSWQKYRTTVSHPAGSLKRADLERAAQNRRRYAWARSFASSVESTAQAVLPKITPEFLTRMIPTDTPGDSNFTPCPACRDQKKPFQSHGQYQWNAADPDHLTCAVCGTVFPSEKYPESLVFKTKSGQTISFYGGEPFNLFGFMTRPSFTAHIRARKVGYAARQCRNLAEAYAATLKPEYAQAARLILLRFAEIYPTWLVHVGYGEYADVDPHIAALNITALPEDEITPTPKGPDRKLHSGYWQGGRASGTGMEAGFVRDMVEAYDFICEAQDQGKPVFSDADRLKIEKDLLLESTVLLVADKAVNNKSVGNATAVALVGMACGVPEMVRFGLDVFMKTVDGWFLPDGSTSESFSYACMTLSGIEALGQAFRGYSDPPGYQDAAGKRIEKLDLYHDTSYKKVWQAMFNGLQGNLRYPPLADGHLTQGLGAHFVELMADNYPDNAQYVALLRELAGPDLSGGDRRTAFYGRPPGLEEQPAQPLTFPDYVYPSLQIGYLRSGATGRDSALILSASDWGGHHHWDSLGLYYWQGAELLSDLGYLWDHPDKHYTYRTFAHNTVMVDGQEQATKGRGGKFTLFSPQGQIKVMEAESQAYPQAGLYRRTVAQIEHEPGRQYVVDVFRVQGGKQHDYVFHGLNNNLQISAPELQPLQGEFKPVRFAIRFALDTPETEIQLDDISLVGPDGKELVTNPSGVELDAKTGKPVDFGLYHGDGTEEWGQAAEGRTDKTSVYLKALAAGKLNMNVALVVGKSDAYTGTEAFEAVPGEKYTVSFWLKGKAKAVAPAVIYWPNNPADTKDRSYVSLGSLATVSAGPEWKQYQATFSLPAPGKLDLTNVKLSPAVADWKLTWKVEASTNFSALWPNEAGYTTLLGTGWGQRDYRNADVGATLPYIVRRHPGGAEPSVFVGAFEGYADQPLVKQVRRLPVPEGEQSNAVAVAVDTATGTDYVVSCLTAKPLRITTPQGPLEMNGRFAALSVRNGQIAAATLVEGTLLKWNGQTVAGQ